MTAGGDAVEGASARVYQREEEADEVAREVLVAVRRSFITPFDRGDIQALIQFAGRRHRPDAQAPPRPCTLFEVGPSIRSMREMGGTVVWRPPRLTAEARCRSCGPSASTPTRAERDSPSGSSQVEGRSDDLHDARAEGPVPRPSGRGDPMAFIVGSPRSYGHLGEGHGPFRGRGEPDQQHRRRTRLSPHGRRVPLLVVLTVRRPGRSTS
ncbi:DUF47 family protein [Caulobacter segnis]